LEQQGPGDKQSFELSQNFGADAGKMTGETGVLQMPVGGRSRTDTLSESTSDCACKIVITLYMGRADIENRRF
jgi:hypothetical protein